MNNAVSRAPVVLVVFLLCFGARSAPKLPARPEAIDFDTLDWRVPSGEPYRVLLDNGLRVWIAEDRTVPLVHFKGYFFGGTILDPRGKEGL